MTTETKQTAPVTSGRLKRMAKLMLKTTVAAVVIDLTIVAGLVVSHLTRDQRSPAIVSEQTRAQTIKKMTALAEFICVVGRFVPHGDRVDTDPDVANDTVIQACAFAKAHGIRTDDIARTPPRLDQPLTRETRP